MGYSHTVSVYYLMPTVNETLTSHISTYTPYVLVFTRFDRYYYPSHNLSKLSLRIYLLRIIGIYPVKVD